MRRPDEITADLDVVKAAPLHQGDDGAYRGTASTSYALCRLIDDIQEAVTEQALAEQLAHAAASISRTVTASYPDSMDAELVMRRRVGKIFVEAGELADAIEGFTGENPRKGVYATREDVIKELIDCASASLCAIEYMTGDRGDSVRMVADQVAGNWERLQAALDREQR